MSFLASNIQSVEDHHLPSPIIYSHAFFLNEDHACLNCRPNFALIITKWWVTILTWLLRVWTLCTSPHPGCVGFLSKCERVLFWVPTPVVGLPLPPSNLYATHTICVESRSNLWNQIHIRVNHGFTLYSTCFIHSSDGFYFQQVGLSVGEPHVEFHSLWITNSHIQTLEGFRIMDNGLSILSF